MNACDELPRLLSLISEGNLSAEKAASVSAHLSGCEGCRLADLTFRSMVVSAKSEYSDEHGIPVSVRRKIAAEASERVLRPIWSWSMLALMPRQVPVFATAMAALLVIVAGLPLARHGGEKASGRGIVAETAPKDDQVMQIEVVADGGSVKLAWSDGNRRSYTVYKTADPRAGGHQEAHLVNGNVWVDSDPQSSPVVFYKIE